MAATYTDNGTNTPNGSHLEFTYTFPVLLTTDVKVSLNNVTQATTKYTVSTSPAKITFNNSSIDSTVQESTGAPKTGVTVRVYRETAVGKNTGDEDPKAVFAAGSSVRAADLNNNFEQVLFAAHEIQEQPINAEDLGTGSITTAKLAADSVDGTKIADDAIDSEHYTDGSIDTAHIADDQVTYAKVQNVSATDRVLGRDSSGAGIIEEITPAALRTMINVEDGATADQTNTEIRTAVEAASDSNVFTDADHTKLNGIATSANNYSISSDLLDEDNFASDSATKPPSQQSTKAYIAATSQPKDNELTTLAGMQTGTASILASGTALTSTTAELNLLDGKSIVTTIGGSATDSELPSAQAVNERIVTLVTEVGGFVPITNETSFPATNPDVNDGAGTIVSVKALASNLVSNGSGVATIANGAGSGNTVTINGMSNSTTYAAGKGLILETTTTLHTYTFHRLVMDETGVSTAQTLVNDFNERYRVNAGEPSSSLNEGDLVYDTNADKMKVYDSSTSAWKEVTSTGDFKYLFLCPAGGTGAPTLNGSIATYDLRESSNSGSAASVTSAAQLLVSINGVIQKANTGTSAPAEGFALVDANTIVFGANIASGDSVFIVQFGSALTITTPGDNTVATAKIQNLAVNNDKIANDTISEAKLDIHNAPSGTDKFLKYTSNGMEWAVDNNTVYTHPNHSGEVTSTADGATVIADNIVDEANLKVSNAPTNGYVLTAQSGNTGGMTWELAAAGATGGNSNGNGVFWENQQTVTHDYTIQNNYNAGSFGPITINSGITVTVGAGESWTVI